MSEKAKSERRKVLRDAMPNALVLRGTQKSLLSQIVFEVKEAQNAYERINARVYIVKYVYTPPTQLCNNP